MENFIVSARKYRPVTFDTVVGQNAITSTLKNAIKTKHLAQAYLFCGPRGVGKTTCARIFAKTINCENLSSNIEACNVCEPCLSFNGSSSFNVFELDAASNNSVDDIRTLVEQVRIPPQVGQYKIYIIDEVHMLSTQAFNAFLKTLEEPPPYAKFILATTEKHKIIPTILSRCQIFDFNRITLDDIAEHLAFVANKENVKTEPEALHIIAQKADGALRDALSIFDQLVSFSGEDGITYQTVLQNLNVLDYDYYFKVIEHLLQDNASEILLLVNEVIEHGFDGHHFIAGLGEHLRNLLVSKDAATVKLLETSENIRLKYKEQAKKCSVNFLMKSLELCTKCDLNYKITSNKRLLIEITMLQMCTNLEPLKTQSSPAILPKAQTSANPIAHPLKQQETTLVKTSEAKKPSISINPEPITESNIPESNSKSEKDLPSDDTKKIIKKNISHPPSLSILTQLSEAENNLLQEDINDYKNSSEEFDTEKLSCAWKNFIETIVQTKPDAASVLKVRIPEIKENFTLDLLADNPVSDSEIISIRNELVEFLRKHLNNNNITLQTRINTNETEAKPFTASEKFSKMSSKNPELPKFKDKFDLELDF